MIQLRLVGVPLLAFSRSFFTSWNQYCSFFHLNPKDITLSPKTDKGATLTHSNAFHLLRVNSNWLVTFTYHQIQWNHSKWKERSCLQLSSRTKTHPPQRLILFCMRRSSSAVMWRKNDFVIKSITRSWLKRCSFHCLPCEGGKPLVPEWYFGQASSISKPPVGVIIAAWNCRCWKVIRSHMVSLSPMTLMSRISHLNMRKMSRTGLWVMSICDVLY